MSLLYYLNPMNFYRWATADTARDRLNESLDTLDELIDELDEAINVETPSTGAHVFIDGVGAPLEPGAYLFKDGVFSKLDTAPPAVTEAPEGKARRHPHPHVTSTAHAGWCLIVDAMKAFVRERLYEPTVVYIDQAAEAVLTQYLYEAGWLGKAKPTTAVVRNAVPTLLGCKVVWDAPSFRFAGEEDPGKRPGPPLVPRGAKTAMSLPFGCVIPRMALANMGLGKTPRPIDSVEIDGRQATVTKADVPEGKSLTAAAEELIRSTADTEKRL